MLNSKVTLSDVLSFILAFVLIVSIVLFFDKYPLPVNGSKLILNK